MSVEPTYSHDELIQQLRILSDPESDMMNAPITAEPAAVVEYRRLLEGRDPQEVLAEAETLLGGLWRNQNPALRALSEVATYHLTPEMVLTFLAQEPLLPGNDVFVNLETYLQEAYGNLVNSGWRFQVKMVKLDVAQDQLAVALAGLTEGDEYDEALKYLPPKPYPVNVPTITITNGSGQSITVFVSTTHSKFVRSQSSALDQGKVINFFEKGGNSYVTGRFNVIDVDISGFENAQRVIEGTSTLVHEIDHSVQRLLSNNRNPRVGTVGIAHKVTIEGSSVTSERVFISRLSNLLRRVVPTDQLPIIERSARSLHALIQSRSPCDRTLFYAAGKILFDRFGIDQSLMTGQMPQHIDLIEQISIKLSVHPELLESLFETVMQDKWKLFLAQAFPDHAPLELMTQDQIPESFRLMFVRDDDIRHYFKVKLTNVADQVKVDYDELGADEESQKELIAKKLSEAFANSIYGQTFSEETKSQIIKDTADENDLHALILWLTDLLPTHDFAIKCWQDLQNPDPEKGVTMAQSIIE